jgi:hypothetical protein
MPRFLTVPPENVERCLTSSTLQVLEPIIVDEVLVAVKWGNHRIAPSSDGKRLIVTQEQPA